LSDSITYEFPVSTEIKDLGFSRIYVVDKTLFVCGLKTKIQCRYYKSGLEKTMKALKQAFIDTNEFDEETIDKLCVLMTQAWVKAEDSNNSTTADNVEGNIISEEIKQLREANSGITYEKWNEELSRRRDKVRDMTELNFPHSWTGIEFTLSVLKILNISECTLPFAGIILSRPGGNKTLSSNMIMTWPYVYYIRNFTAKAFVSHNTAVRKEKLPEIDMLPRTRFKMFLTPELTPTFSANEDDLRETLGIITSVLDGHGYVNHSGAQGRRGYTGNYMFVWVGAAVDVPYRVHKLLATLGPKLYFFRLPYVEKTEQQLLNCLNENFEQKRKDVQTAVIEYLKWFEICPTLVEDQESGLLKIAWNSENDDDLAKDYIIKLGKFLAKIRGHVDAWSSKGTGHTHEYTEYSYGFTQSEDPARASTQLYNLARGHALLMGRNYITIEDLPITVKVVLSTASVERVAILDLLLRKKESITLSGIVKVLPISKSSALKAMTELAALKVVNMDETVVGSNFTKQITLRQEFNWLFSDEFSTLRQGFNPVDSSEYDTMDEDNYALEEQDQTSSGELINSDNLTANPILTGWSKDDAPLCVEGMTKAGLETVTDKDDEYRVGGV
jgi:hypothetical protein